MAEIQDVELLRRMVLEGVGVAPLNQVAVQKDLKLEVGKDLDLGTIKVKRGRTIEGQVVNAPPITIFPSGWIAAV